MTTETEIKFIAHDAAAEQLPQILAQWPHRRPVVQSLSNIYLETADYQLRGWDMGLRIRGWDGQYEMTLKTAGNTVGGLHQRTEYTLPLTQPEADITRLPVDVWPAGTDIAGLQQALTPLFSTNFSRTQWVVTYGQSEIEVVLDRGAVVAGEQKEPLQEIELELKSGQRDDLLALATELAVLPGLRLGSQSKAARGYWLAKGRPEQPLRAFPVLVIPAKSTVEEGMCRALSQALTHWQYHEELWLRASPAACNGIKEALEAIRQLFSLYGAMIPRKANAQLRQQLTLLEQQLESTDIIAENVLFSPIAVHAQLALTQWIVTSHWRGFLDDKAQRQLGGSFKRFADIMLGRIAADLKKTFANVNKLSAFSDKQRRLLRQILAVRLLAGAYNEKQTLTWLESWQQLLQAIANGDLHQAIERCAQAIKQPAFWKNNRLR
ncbi:inorganic triphosphatase [Enterobacteriaceae bacterium LUAb1]